MTGLTSIGSTGENTTFNGPIVASEGLTGNLTGNAATATTLSTTLPINLGGTGSTTPIAARNSLGIYSGIYEWREVDDLASPSNDIDISLPPGVTLSVGGSVVTATINSNNSGNPNTIILQVKVKDTHTIEVILNSALAIDDLISYIIIP